MSLSPARQLYCFTVWLLVTWAIAVPRLVRAEDELSGVSQTIMVISPDDNAQYLARLGEALEAHLSDFDIAVQSLAIPTLPPNFAGQVDLARQTSEASQALAVVWIDLNQGLVYVLTVQTEADQQGARAVQILDRPIPEMGADSSSDCDAIASVVRSVLTPLVNQNIEDPDLIERDAEREENKENAPTVMLDTEPVEEKPRPVAEERRLFPVSLVLAGAYAPTMVTWASVVQQGGHINVGAIIGPYVELGAGIDLLSFIETKETGDGTELARWPLRFSLMGILPIGDLELGLRAALVLDFTRVEGVDNEEVQGDTERTSPAFSPSLVARYFLFRLIAVWVEVGLNIYGQAFDYTRNGQTLIYLNSIQPRGAAGLVLIVPLG